MARQNSGSDMSNGWISVCEGVSLKKGRENRISINWFGAVIHNVRVVNGPNGKFLSWPAFKGKDGNYISTAYVYAPRGSEDAKILENVLIAAI